MPSEKPTIFTVKWQVLGKGATSTNFHVYFKNQHANGTRGLEISALAYK
jgi:hypothetical protein